MSEDLEMWCIISRLDGGLGGYARLTGEETQYDLVVDRIGISDGKHMFYTDYPQGKRVNVDAIYVYGVSEAQYLRLIRLENELNKAVRRAKLDYEARKLALLVERDRDIDFLDQQFRRMCDIILEA